MTEWLKGFIAGITSGLVLAMLWDTFNIRRLARQGERKILSAVKEELSHNLATLQANKELLIEELDTIFEENNIIHTLIPLQANIKDMIKVNIPNVVIKVETLTKLRHTTHAVDSINEQIRGRETYRNSEQDVSIYYRHIKKFDERILKNSDSLTKSLEELQSLL
ncbi:MAG: hypothetical protein Q7U10_06775 [Thermodesulfovibrionia bacterium]|nr:hypothetical protein [Thermodesulfovibrionia bacterium]